MVEFVNYTSYRIQLESPGSTLGMIVVFLIIVSVMTCKRERPEFLDKRLSVNARGFAILCVILGHFATKCVAERTVFVGCGYLGVVLFLFLSGYGVHRRYGAVRLGWDFWARRLVRIYPALWLSLVLFAVLDRVLIDLHHPGWELAVNFLGVHFNGALVRVNSASWFVGFLIWQYVLYFLVSYLRVGEFVKVGVLVVLGCGTLAVVAFSCLKAYLGIWGHYVFVYPVGVLASLVQGGRAAARGEFALGNAGALAILASVCLVFGLLGWAEPFLRWFRLLVGVPIALVFVYALVWFGFVSRFLEVLGKYSYEMFLMHLPFMVKYDFFLYRKPTCLFFFVYLFCVLFWGWLLRGISEGFSAGVRWAGGKIWAGVLGCRHGREVGGG